MGSTSLRPSGTRGARTDPTLTSAPKDRGPQATLRPEHRTLTLTLTLFIGGTGDKKSYYFAGPYRNIAYALDAFDQRIEESGHADGYQSLYLGYHEVWSASAIGRLVTAEVHDRSTPSISSSAIAFAPGAARICRSASANGLSGGDAGDPGPGGFGAAGAAGLAEPLPPPGTAQPRLDQRAPGAGASSTITCCRLAFISNATTNTA